MRFGGTYRPRFGWVEKLDSKVERMAEVARSLHKPSEIPGGTRCHGAAIGLEHYSVNNETLVVIDSTELRLLSKLSTPLVPATEEEVYYCEGRSEYSEHAQNLWGFLRESRPLHSLLDSLALRLQRITQH